MIKKIYLFLFPIFLYGNFSEGVLYFQDGNFSKSYEIFQKLFREDMENPQVSFYLGRSAFELGFYDESAIAFQRVLILDPNHLRSELELGRIYLFLGNFKEAKSKLQKVLSSEIPDEVRKNVEKLLVEVKEQRDYFTLLFSVESGFETNINSSAGDEKIRDYLSEKYGLNRDGFEVEDREDSIFHNETLSLQHKHNFRNTYLQTSLNLFNQSYIENSDYNIFYSSIGTLLGFQNFRFQLLADRVFYGEDPLLNSYFAEVEYRKSFESFQFETYLKHRWKVYEESDRDSTQDDGGVSLFKSFGKNLFGLSYSYLIENRKSGDYRFIDKDEHSLKFLYKRKLPFGIYGDLQFYKRFIDFDDEVDGESREDIYSSFLISFSKEIWRDFSANISYNYIENSSNYTPVEYDKSIYSFGINYRY
jgi:tetratricopeptide (TPR) repeat protein